MCAATEDISEEEFDELRNDVRDLKQIIDKWDGAMTMLKWVLGVIAGAILLLISTLIGTGISMSQWMSQSSTTMALNSEAIEALKETEPRFTRQNYLDLHGAEVERSKVEIARQVAIAVKEVQEELDNLIKRDEELGRRMEAVERKQRE